MIERSASGAIVLSVLLIAVLLTPAQAEEGTVKALSGWQGKGELFKIGESQGLFVGRFAGIMFVETGEGALDAADIICPANMEVNLQDGSQAGKGRCVITGRSGDQVFAEWECKGVHLVGCKGSFKITGGTGKFRGMTGESEFLVRAAVVDREATLSTASVHETAVGLAVWPKLHYKIP